MPEQDKTNNWFLMKEKFYSKILFILLLSLLMILISSSYYKYIIKEDFILYAEVSCDPSFESCFIYECSEEDENCDSNDPNQYYKIIYKKAKNVPSCDIYECEELTCSSEEDCEIITCTEGEEGVCS